MYTYNDHGFDSKVNDFGDDYHKPDIEASITDSESLRRVKSLKRRYRDFGEYCDAVIVFEDYMEELVYRYGGKKRFKNLMLMGMVKEYIPVVPQLKKTKFNKRYIDGGASREFVDHELARNMSSPIADEDVKIVDVVVGTKNHKNKAKLFEDKITFGGGIKEKLSADIETIEKYYRQKTSHPTRLSKKAMKRRLKQQKAFDDDYITLDERFKEYYRKVDNEEYDDYDPKAIIYYKGSAISASEAEELEVYDFLRGLGFNMGKKALGKKSRKIIRRNERKEKKAKKKNKKEVKLRKKYMSQFGNGEYKTFEDFERAATDFVYKKNKK
jgi:hypothetical protein